MWDQQDSGTEKTVEFLLNLWSNSAALRLYCVLFQLLSLYSLVVQSLDDEKNYEGKCVFRVQK